MRGEILQNHEFYVPYVFDIDFKNVYKKVDRMLISMYVISIKIDT